MTTTRYIFSVLTHSTIAMLFLIGSFGINGEVLCSESTACSTEKTETCCTTKKEKPVKKTSSCCSDSKSDVHHPGNEEDHQSDHICRCCTVVKNLVSPTVKIDSSIGVKVNLVPGELNSFFTSLHNTKHFHPPNSIV